MAKECLICGKIMGAFYINPMVVSDGQICRDCYFEAGLNGDDRVSGIGKYYSSTTIKEMISAKRKNLVLIQKFHPTKIIGPFAFDDNTQTFTITKCNDITNLYTYSQIESFELLEDGFSVTKGGLGSAVAGGLLFGGVGAIVGGITGSKKTKDVCKSMQIRVTFRNSPYLAEIPYFIVMDTDVNSMAYKEASQSAQAAIVALQNAVNLANPQTTKTNIQTISSADEILKFKQLLDMGIISQEEFEAKKKQLLGL